MLELDSSELTRRVILKLNLVAYRAFAAFAFLVRREQEIQGRYDVDLAYFKWLMHYESRNLMPLKVAIKELQRADFTELGEVIGDGPVNLREYTWSSVPVLGPVMISNGRLIFEMSAILQRQLKDPEKAHWLSWHTMPLTLLYARAIFSHTHIYLSEGISPWIPVETVQAWPGEGSATSPFKYFKRDSLEPAIKQINENSNINIAFETQTEPGSRRVTHLRFQVSLKESMSLQGEEYELKEIHELYCVLKDEFNLSQDNLTEIAEINDRWNASWINQAIEFTRWSINQGKVESPAEFLMQSLRNNVTASSSKQSHDKMNPHIKGVC